MKLHGASATGPEILHVGETRARAPGKIVHILGVEGQRLRAVGMIRGSDEIAACAHDFILRKRHVHVKRPEIREEFRGVVKLMTIPRTLPPDANLRKPLADHVKIAQISSSRDDFGHLSLKAILNSTSAPAGTALGSSICI